MQRDACNTANLDAIMSTVRDNLISRGTPGDDVVSIESTCNNNVVDVQVTLMSTITAELLVRNVALGQIVLGDGTVGELTPPETTTTAITPTTKRPNLLGEMASPSSGTTNWQTFVILGLLVVIVIIVAAVLAKRRSRRKGRFPRHDDNADAPEVLATPIRGTLPTRTGIAIPVQVTGTDVTPEQKKPPRRNLGAARTLYPQTAVGEDPDYELGDNPGRCPPAALPPKSSAYEYDDTRVNQDHHAEATYGDPEPYAGLDYDVPLHVVSPAYDEAGGVVAQHDGGGGGRSEPRQDRRPSIPIYEPLYAEIRDVLPGYEVPTPVYGPRGYEVPTPVYGPRGYEVPTPVCRPRGYEVSGPGDGSQGYEVPAPVKCGEGGGLPWSTDL